LRGCEVAGMVEGHTGWDARGGGSPPSHTAARAGCPIGAESN